MPEMATISQVVQVGLEPTPGTSVAANRMLRSIGIDPAIQKELSMLDAIGGKFPIASVLGKEWTEAKLSGNLTYSEIVYVLASVLQNVTPTQISPPSGLAYRWTFAPSQSTEDSIATYTVERGSSLRAMRFSYGIVTEFSISFDREQIEIDGSMLGHRLEDGVSLTNSPTLIDIVPVVPSQVSIFMDSSAADLGTTRLTRVLSAEFSISDRFGPIWTLDATQRSFASHVETSPKATMKVKMEADAAGMSPLSAMREGERRFIRVEAVGPNIESGADHLFRIDMCGLVSDVSEFSDEDGVWAIEWTFSATYDETWGKALEVQVVNTLSAL